MTIYVQFIANTVYVNIYMLTKYVTYEILLSEVSFIAEEFEILFKLVNG